VPTEPTKPVAKPVYRSLDAFTVDDLDAVADTDLLQTQVARSANGVTPHSGTNDIIVVDKEMLKQRQAQAAAKAAEPEQPHMSGMPSIIPDDSDGEEHSMIEGSGTTADSNCE